MKRCLLRWGIPVGISCLALTACVPHASQRLPGSAAQDIEETVAVCSYFSQHADEYSLNVEKIGFAGDSAGAMLALASAL
ncbi:alpha/beta hydrolase fold domain-containing protein, partial [Salmonella enterica subsp. enterica serovar Virginia]|nr:alpha/beta hydrolase fold domain-containing protein [Salmonella enterica subsp. enterica serovar Virginia]